MTTAIAKPVKQKSDIHSLRKMAEQHMQEMHKKMEEMQAVIEQLNAALGEIPPRPSPLDDVHKVIKATEDLRATNGNLSATAISKALGVSVNELAGWLRRSRQSVTKTPDADSLQDALAFFERVARLRAVITNKGFLNWLRMRNPHLDNRTPLELLSSGDRQVVADLVDDMLTGAPT